MRMWTTHGHWTGAAGRQPTPEQLTTRPTTVARCSGPGGCDQCSREAGTAIADAVELISTAPLRIGDHVHYRSYGTPGGEYPPTCRAAIVSEHDPRDPHRVGLVVLNPTGLFFHSLADGGCDWASGPRATGGTWHQVGRCTP